MARLYFAALVFLIPLVAAGQSITGVSGAVAAGDTIMIAGSGFGANGPSVELFDSFQRGSDGVSMTASCDVGNWTVINSTWDPKFVADDVPGGSNVAGQLVYLGVQRQAQFVFPSPVQEIFLSYRLKIPDGKYFPWAFAEDTFSGGSNWKVTWLMDQEFGFYGEDDWCLPTWVGAFYTAGNDAVIPAHPDTRTNHFTQNELMWFSFDVWNRYTVYMKAGPDPDNDNGYIWQQGMSEPLGQVNKYTTNWPLFDGGPEGAEFPGGGTDNGISQWDRLYVPGWARGSQGASAAGGIYPDPDSEVWYDDIYVATGDYARARVEIGNSSTYSASTLLALCIPTSWSDTSVSAAVYASGFDTGDAAWVYIVDSDGDVSDGWPVTISGEGGSSEWAAPVVGGVVDSRIQSVSWDEVAGAEYYTVWVIEQGGTVPRTAGVFAGLLASDIPTSTEVGTVYVTAHAANHSLLATSQTAAYGGN